MRMMTEDEGWAQVGLLGCLLVFLLEGKKGRTGPQFTKLQRPCPSLNWDLGRLRGRRRQNPLLWETSRAGEGERMWSTTSPIPASSSPHARCSIGYCPVFWVGIKFWAMLGPAWISLGCSFTHLWIGGRQCVRSENQTPKLPGTSSLNIQGKFTLLVK